LPLEMDTLAVECIGAMTPQAVRSFAEAVLPKWIAKAGGRPVVLMPYESYGGTVLLDTFRAYGQVVDDSHLAGAIFIVYGDETFEGTVTRGFCGRLELVDEVREIARQWGVVRPRPSGPKRALQEKQTALPAPATPELRHAAALRHVDLADSHGRAGRSGEAEKACRLALGSWEKLAAEYPDNLSYPDWLVQTEWRLAGFVSGPTRVKEAEACLRRALGHAEKLLAASPGEPVYREGHAFGFWLLGKLLRDTERTQEAENAFRRAVAIHEKLVAEFPTAENERSRLATYLGELTETLLRQGKHAEAAKVAEKVAGVIPEDSNGYRRAADFFSRCVPLAEKDAALPQADRTKVAKRYADRSQELTSEADKRTGEKPAAPGQKPKQ